MRSRLLACVLGIVAAGCSFEWEVGSAAATGEATGTAPAPRTGPSPAPAPAEPAERARSAPASRAAALDLFPSWAEGRRFLLASDVDLPLGELAEHADEAYLRFAERLAVPPDRHPTERVPVYLASGVDLLLAVERRHGFPSSDHSARTFEFRGGFYPQGPVIAVVAKDLHGARSILRHEIAHLALTRAVPEPPDLVNEGLADLLGTWIHHTPDLPLEGATSVHPNNGRRCRRAVEAGEVPPLRDLFALDYWEFRDDRFVFLHYALGWHLVRFLLEDGHPAVAGRFDDYLDELRFGRAGWDAFRRTYDAPLAERLWREELARPLAWRPLFGRWQDTNGGFRADLRDRGSAILLHAERPRPGRPWEIAYEVAVPDPGLPPAVGIGFVVAHRSAEDLHLLSLRGAGREVDLYHHGGTRNELRWRKSSGVTSARLALRIETDGSLLLRLDGERVARFGPVEGVHSGEVGLMFEWRRDESHETEIFFRNVRVRGG